MRCYKRTEWGVCKQEALEGFTFCGYHERRRQDGLPGDQFYEELVAKGLVEPTDHWMTAPEVKAMFDGRKHGDGRRLDQWTK